MSKNKEMTAAQKQRAEKLFEKVEFRVVDYLRSINDHYSGKVIDNEDGSQSKVFEIASGDLTITIVTRIQRNN